WMRAFIVRPFNTQAGVDFEAVERDLIAPALETLAIEGRTTQEIVAQGNIRADMFRMLVSADLVVADLSIHNANVFYELGIRHGLRNSATFLIRANIDKYPFDLSTDRYFIYDAADPKASLNKLVGALRSTLAMRNVDSPVYEMLPALKPPDPASLQAAPREFREDVECARDGGYRGDLRLLAHEARGFEWEREGLRCVGRAQLKLRAYPGAQETFEWLLDANEDDLEAWQRLATVYQRLAGEDASLSDAARSALLARSTQAIRRVLESPVATARHLAEGYALQGRNAKSEWRDAWTRKTGPDAAAAALRSPLLREAADLYAKGFEHDLSHCYPGLNAMSLYRLLTELARAQPAVWAEPFDSDDDARLNLKACDDVLAQLGGAVRWSMRATRNRLDRQATRDEEESLWLSMSEADYAFLTSVRPGPAAQAYRKVLSAAPAFDASSAREQLEIFGLLGVRTDIATPSLAVFDELAPHT
ncbi:MAG: tetratricopeptide repeat-containing protein, partial [Vicinamibacterales bacterium]